MVKIPSMMKWILVAVPALLSSCIFINTNGTELPNELTGTLFNRGGTPVADALVRIFPDTGTDAILSKMAATGELRRDSVRTDANGRFRFSNVKDGRYNLECTVKKNGDTQTLFIPGIQCKGGFDLGRDTLRMSGNILITTQTENGAPLSGVTCEIPGSPFVATSDSLGKCVITGAPEGTFKIRLQKNGFSTSLSAALQVNSGRTVDGGVVTLYPSALIAYWNFDEGSGSILQDRAANGHDGTLKGTSLPAWAQDGVSGGSLHFSETTYVEVPASAAFSGMESFSFSAWIWQDVQDMDEPVMEFSQAGALTGAMLWVNTSGFEIVIPGSVMGCFRNLSGASGYVYNTPGGIAPKSRWNHLVLTYDAPAHSSGIYVNGVLQASYVIPESYTPSKAGPLYLGLRPKSSAESRAGACFRGRMDEVRVYSTALSDAEIAALYSAAGN